MNGRRLVALLPLLGALALGSALAQEPPATGGAATDAGETAASAPGDGTAAASAVDVDPERVRSEMNRELKTVEQDTNRLKERVFRSKATLQLLKELVLDTSGLGSKVTVWHVNKMGSAYSMESAQYFLDGKNIFARMDAEGGLDKEREIKLIEQAMPPGTHNLQASLVLRGNGFGVFSYLQSYSFKVTSSYSFTVEDGRETVVKVIANERGGPWRTFVDRPNVEYDEQSDRLKETQ